MDRRAFVAGLRHPASAACSVRQLLPPSLLRAAVSLPREGCGRSMPDAPCANRSVRRKRLCLAPLTMQAVMVNDKEEL
jgi:hypothetical protein